MAIHASSTPAPARPLLRLAPGRPPEPLLAAAAARAIHLRRELERAIDHGTALLAALGLPRLVEPGFVPLDPIVLANALDLAVETLDALDAPGEDIEPASDDDACILEIWGEGDEREDAEDGGDAEPSLGAPENHPCRWHFDMEDRYHVGRRHHSLGDQTTWAAGGSDDREDPNGDLEHEAGYDLPEGDDERCGSGEVDAEPPLGWGAGVCQVRLHGNYEVGDEAEHTAPERHGCGFVRCGPDDAEDDELEDEHEHDPLHWVFGPSRSGGAYA